MKILIILFTLFVIGVNSRILEDEHRQKLREIRNVCIVESRLNPYEIGNVIRAIRPAEKLVNASKCIVQKLITLREEDETINEIINRTKLTIGKVNLPQTIDVIINSCENLLGKVNCEEIIKVLGLVVDNIRNRNPLLREA